MASKLNDVSPETTQATNNLFASFTRGWTRRGLLKGAAVGTGTMLASASLLNALPAEAATSFSQQALSIAATAEQLAITFYSHGINHHECLGIYGDNLIYLKAAVAEEQIHHNFFVANGGVPLTSTFSFPHGADTFRYKNLFIETQQQLEGVFDSAFLAAIREFADRRLSRFAQIMGQVACVEAEHRVLGRVILGAAPADNFGYEPVLIHSVLDAPTVVTRAGYLSPRSGNTYHYHPVNAEYPGVIYTTPYAV